jgi:hypothetical protein
MTPKGRLCVVYTVSGGLTQHAFGAEGTRIAKGSLEPGANSTSAHSFRSRFSLIDRYPVGLGGEQVTEFFGGGSETWMHSSTWACGKLVATCDTTGIQYEPTGPLETELVQVTGAG